MKKVTSLLIGFFILTGCAETVALFGPASQLAMGGSNIVQSTATTALNFGVKKQTGKSPMEHALAYAKEKNPTKEKDRCISFVKKSASEACYIAKKQISLAKKSALKKIKKVVRLETKTEKKNISKKDLSLQYANLKEDSKIKKNSLSTQIETKKKLELKSVESMIVETAMSKKQINQLRVAIEKRVKIKDLTR